MSTMRDTERGAALVVSLIMLVLITLMVIAALNLSTANFRAVSNTQFRNQAIAAANVAIADRISSTFDAGSIDPGTGLPATTYPTVDLNNDGVVDYTVAVTPACMNASIAESADPSSVSLPGYPGPSHGRRHRCGRRRARRRARAAYSIGKERCLPVNNGLRETP